MEFVPTTSVMSCVLQHSAEEELDSEIGPAGVRKRSKLASGIR